MPSGASAMRRAAKLATKATPTPPRPKIAPCDVAQRHVFSLPCEPLKLVKQAGVLYIPVHAHRCSSTVSYSALLRREVHSTSCPRLALQ